jgi:hypothetical protein
MEAGRTVKKIYDWQPHAIRKRGRRKIRWKDDVREDLKDLGIYNWITRTQDRIGRKLLSRPKRSRNEAVEPCEEEEEYYAYHLNTHITVERFS